MMCQFQAPEQNNASEVFTLLERGSRFLKVPLHRRTDLYAYQRRSKNLVLTFFFFSCKNLVQLMFVYVLIYSSD